MAQKGYDPRFTPDAGDESKFQAYHPKFVPDDSNEESNILGDTWEAINKPLFSIKKLTSPTDSVRVERNEKYRQEHPTITKIDDFVNSIVEAIPSALNLATAGAGAASNLAAKAALPRIAEKLHKATQLLSAPVAAEGAYHTLRPDADLSERGLGVLETLGGAAGMFSGGPSVRNNKLPEISTEELPIRSPQKALPSARFIAGEEGIAAPGDVFPTKDALAPIRSSEELPVRKPRIRANLDGTMTPVLEGEVLPSTDRILKSPIASLTDDELHQITKLHPNLGGTAERATEAQIELMNRDPNYKIPHSNNPEFTNLNTGEISNYDLKKGTRESYIPETPAKPKFVNPFEKPKDILDAEITPSAEAPKTELNGFGKFRADTLTKLKEAEEAAKTNIKKRGSFSGDKITSGLDPQDLSDLAVIGASKLAHGINDFARWSAAMVKDLGEFIRPHLEAIFKAASERIPKIESAKIETPKTAETTVETTLESTSLTKLPEGKEPPRLAGLQNHGDGVLYIQFDKSNPVKPEDVKQMFPGKNITVTEFNKNSFPENLQKFRIDAYEGDGVFRSPTLGDEIEKAVGGAFQEFDKPKGFNPEAEMQGGIGGVKPPSSVEPNKGPAGAAVDKLLDSIAASKDLRVEQERLNKIERAKRFAASAGVKEEGIKGAKMSLHEMSGEFDVPETANLYLNRAETNSLFTAIKKANVTEPEKIRGRVALFKLINGGSIPARSELKVLDDVFGGGFAEKIIEMHGGLGAVKLNIGKLANTMKAMMSSTDLSFGMYQGRGMFLRSEYWDAAGDIFTNITNPEAYNAAMSAIESRPLYLVGKEAGLFLAKPGNLLEGEEAFLNNFVHYLPGIRSVVAASERAYTGFLNKLRADTFDNLVKNAQTFGSRAFEVVDYVDTSDMKLINQLKKEAKSLGIPENIKDDKFIKFAKSKKLTRTMLVPTKVGENIANYINVSTGRGGLGKLERMAPELNTVLWSPRLISSRLTMLNPKYYYDMDKFTQREAIKSLFAIAATGTVITGLGAAAGGKQNFDITSSDFAKSRFGQDVLDGWAGFQQPIVAAARMIKELNRMRTNSPKNFNDPSILGIGGNFLKNKESPIASFVHDILTARAYSGETQAPDLKHGTLPQVGGYTDQYGNKKFISKELELRFVPIFTQNVYDILMNDKSFAAQIGLDSAALVGLGVQDYPERKANTSMNSSMRIQKMRLSP